MKKLICGLVFISAFAFHVIGQESDDSDNGKTGTFWSKLAIGGNLALQFGNITYIDISPAVIYRASDNLQIGVGPIYQFVRYRNYFYPGQDDKFTIYGGRTFLRYIMFESLFAHAEHQLLNLDAYDEITFDITRKNINVLLLGGGYRQLIGGSSYMYIGVLYDVIQDRNSPYYNRPIYQIGFGIGI